MRRTSLRTLALPLARSSTLSTSALRCGSVGHGSFLTSRGFASEPPAATKLKPDQPHPSWNDYSQLLNNFMDKLVHKERMGYKWWVRPNPSAQTESPSNYHLWFDEEQVRLR